MNYTITEELQDRLNHWSKELDLTSILAVQNTGTDSFDVTINTGNEVANWGFAFVSIVASLYIACDAEHREDFAESIFDLVDIGLDKGRKWVLADEG